MPKDIFRQWAVIISYLAMFIVNSLANILRFNGQATGEISDRFDVYFVPAGYVFFIWFVIYFLLGVYAIYQLLPTQRENPRLRATGWLFVGSNLANIAWLFLWHYEVFPLTLIAMLSLLLILMAMYLRLGTGRTSVTAGERWAVRLPFSVYLGWITVATIANVTWLLDYWQWNGWGINPQTWTVIMLAVAVLVALLMAFRHRDVPYLLVLAWSFAGIALKHADVAVVMIAAWIAVGMMGVGVILGGLRKRVGDSSK